MIRLVMGKVRDQERALRRMAKRSQTLRLIGHQVLGKRQSTHVTMSELRTKIGTRIIGQGTTVQTTGIDPVNMVWIFGSGRSGSTWLRNMMGEIHGHLAWDEPKVGRLFGDFYYNETIVDKARASFIMGDPTRKGWVRSIRNFVLNGARYANPRYRPGNYLIIKEPNGSAGAPLLMEALPESRIILLIRDPRDVVASVMDAVSKGGWLYELREKRNIWKSDSLAEDNPDMYVREQAHKYLYEAGNAKNAYDQHKGLKVLIRYEDLRADTFAIMKHLYASLEIPVDERELERAVSVHSWENIPAKDKGPGKFTRKATPGGWREDLAAEQVRIVEEVTAPLLEELYQVSQ